jgi:rod shape determining protein RodA
MMKRMNSNINPPLIGGEETGEVVRGPIMQFLHNFFSHFDLMQVIPALILISAGILFIYGTGEQAGYGAGLFWKRQFFYAIAGVCVWLFLTFFDYRWLSPASVPFYIISNILLIAVLFLGPEVNNAHRWLDIGGYSLQPSEFGKLAVVLSLSWLLSLKNADINKPLWALAFFGTFLIPFLLIYKEPDLGSAMVLLPTAAAIAFVANLKLRYILIAVVAIGILMPVTYHYFMRPYQKERIQTYLDPNRDMGWNARQAEIAVGSGGLTGKGFMNGTHCVLGYLPKRVANSDFIFPVISEETGFLGAFLLIVLYGCLLFSVFRTALLAPDSFGRYLCTGIGTVIAVHTVVNMGMSIRLVPITGLPLPLVSYGGTFLVTVMVYLGIVQSIYAHRARETFLTTSE